MHIGLQSPPGQPAAGQKLLACVAVPQFDQKEKDSLRHWAIITGAPSKEAARDLNLQSCCRANFRVLALIVGISALAACNALYVPLRLERVIHAHPRSAALLEAAAADGWLQEHSHVTTSGLSCMHCVDAKRVRHGLLLPE